MYRQLYTTTSIATTVTVFAGIFSVEALLNSRACDSQMKGWIFQPVNLDQDAVYLFDCDVHEGGSHPSGEFLRLCAIEDVRLHIVVEPLPCVDVVC